MRLTGLRETVAGFRQMDAQLPKHLRIRFKAVADLVVGRVQQRMPFSSGEAAHSLKPVAGSLYAGIQRPAGGSPWRGVKADYYPWLDFGGSVGRGKSPNTPWSGSTKRLFIKGGRYLYPAIAESSADIVKAADAAIADTAREAGFETHP